MPSTEAEITSVQRQREFAAAERQRLLQETDDREMTVSHVASRHHASPEPLARLAQASPRVGR